MKIAYFPGQNLDLLQKWIISHYQSDVDIWKQKSDWKHEKIYIDQYQYVSLAGGTQLTEHRLTSTCEFNNKAILGILRSGSSVTGTVYI
jgi:hypothetical protein